MAEEKKIPQGEATPDVPDEETADQVAPADSTAQDTETAGGACTSDDASRVDPETVAASSECASGEPSIPVSETTVDSEMPPADKPSELSAEAPVDDVREEDVLAAVAMLRSETITRLLGNDWPAENVRLDVSNRYGAALSAAATFGVTPAGEAGVFLEEVARRHGDALALEKSATESVLGEDLRYRETYARLGNELEGLAAGVGAVLERMNNQEPRYEEASAELKAALANYRKGIEILQRMLGRLKERMKEPLTDPALALSASLDTEPPPSEAGGWAVFVQTVSRQFHTIRDTNYHARQRAVELASNNGGLCRDFVKSVASIVDGIDSGHENEEQSCAKLRCLAQDSGPAKDLVESWCGVYASLLDYVDAFFAKTGIEAQTVEPGTPFDPERMEPQGTVTEPALQNDDVAAVIRRGFSLNGELIRPMVVDVVKND